MPYPLGHEGNELFSLKTFESIIICFPFDHPSLRQIGLRNKIEMIQMYRTGIGNMPQPGEVEYVHQQAPVPQAQTHTQEAPTILLHSIP